jgi:hypothetical protein
MKPILTKKQWLLPLIAVCALTACKKDLKETIQPETTTTATDSKNVKFNCSNRIINSIIGGDTRGYSGDGGPVKYALINDPENVYVDKRGNIFIADRGNSRVRKVMLIPGLSIRLRKWHQWIFRRRRTGYAGQPEQCFSYRIRQKKATSIFPIYQPPRPPGRPSHRHY